MVVRLRDTLRRRSRQAKTAVFMIVSGVMLPHAYAEHLEGADVEPSTIVISVRTIQASQPTTENANAEDSRSTPRLDHQLSDIEKRLITLPFTRFELLASKSETITLRKKNLLQLPNGHSLAFRPVYMEHKKVGIWLNWRDKDGSEILNTRVHFDANDSVVTGTDSANDTGLILAIKAVPVENSK